MSLKLENEGFSLKWWEYLMVGIFVEFIGITVNNSYPIGTVMSDIGGAIQLISWGMLITGIIKAIKGIYRKIKK